MSLAGFDLHVYLGLTRVGVARSGAEPVWASAGSLDEGLAKAFELVGAATQDSGIRRRGNLRLWLSGGLARPFLMQPIDGVKLWTDAIKIAPSLAPEATGLGEPCTVWLDAWNDRQASLAVAVPTSLLERIERLASESGRYRVKGVRPWWSWVMSQHASHADTSPAMLAVRDSDAMSLLGWADSEDAPKVANCYWPLPDDDQATSLVRRAAMSAGLAGTPHPMARLDPAGGLIEQTSALVPPFAHAWGWVE